MAKSTKARPVAARSGGRRREEIRRHLPRQSFRVSSLFERVEFVNAGLILLLFGLIIGSLVAWSREQVGVALGQLVDTTRVKRVDFTVVDEDATEQNRETARRDAPRVYRINESYLERLSAAINELPRAVLGKTTMDEISDELIEEFNLTPEALAALQPYAADQDKAEQWKRATALLTRESPFKRPIIESKEFQNYSKTVNRALLLPTGELEPLTDPGISLPAESAGASPELRDELLSLVTEAGFPAEMAPMIVSRLLWQPDRTIIHAPEATADAAERAAELVPPVLNEHEKGEIIYSRGNRLDAQQMSVLLDERQAFLSQSGTAAVTSLWLPRAGSVLLCMLLVALVGVFILINYPHILDNPLRLSAIGGLVTLMAVCSIILRANVPQLSLAAAIVPTLLVAVLLQLAYDQRMAMVSSILQAVIVTIAFTASAPLFFILLLGCGVFAWQLRALRHRNSLIRASIVTAAALAVGTLLVGFMTTPPVELPTLLTHVTLNAAIAAASSVGVGFLVLGILPSFERLFDVTTGMKLVELRDTSQPLLRQLQQLAPGTYNHSLQVANIAEAAADSIGADSLLVYVGALYHDIGKMNKPEYFIENQSGGVNKHNKLRPAMSLLVIIGHVKDGIELAREYALPRALIHFIESHHGTTLVEYFYHAAKTQAEANDKGSVDEVEFRYPGPKPQTKEAAILMLSDAVESATRAMAEPHPSRIENLVRELSRRRLLDGQFDECGLSFRELHRIEDAVIARLCAIHHGRISYPSGGKQSRAADDASAAQRPPQPQQAAGASPG